MQNNSLATIHPKSLPINYSVVRGISEEGITHLLSYTRLDIELKSQTSDLYNPDGTPGRFSSYETFQSWIKQGKYIYSLLQEDGQFSGIIWFSKDPMVYDGRSYDFTFGIRLYGASRGIGLAKPFSQVALKDFLSSPIYSESTSHGIWLRTSADNLPAIKTYHSLGYNQIKSVDQTGKITMVLQ